MRLSFALSLLAIGAFAVSCDNVARAFDPDVTPGGPTVPDGEVIVERVPEGGDTRDGRPKVKAAFPEGGGWPVTVPIVVEFSESVNATSIRPTTTNGPDGRIIVRVVGSPQALPCEYDFVAGGRVLVMRPTPTLSNTGNPSYEVVLLPDARDCDGVRFQVPAEGTVLTEFQVNQDESFDDGRIVTTFPRDNQRDAVRMTDYFVFFDRPANENTLTAANLFLRPQGGVALAGAVDVPLRVAGVRDPRVARFRPSDLLAAGTRFELVVNSSITFGSAGQLDFRNRTPYATFQTIDPSAPTAVSLQNFSAGYPEKINRNNMAAVMLAVQTPADALEGDRVFARIYGGDASTAAGNDVAFVERVVPLAAGGAQTVQVDFTGLLGSLTSPKFDDGDILFAAQMRRGSQQSGYVHGSGDDPRFDVTPPTLTQAGPGGGSATDYRTDQEHLVFFGLASELLGDAELVANSQTATMFASASDGRFVMTPIAMNRRSTPLPYSLLLTDFAGNMAVAAVTGNVLQRGVVTGAVAGTLTVEAYDDATLLPITGATVLVDPGVPTVPATGQLSGTTGVDGRAEFTGLGGSSHTVTIVRAGYDLVTFYNTGAAFVSLPLRPIANATATLNGNVVFESAPGATALLGHSAIDDARVLAVATASSAPNTIPDTAIRPARPQMITAFTGTIEPTASPTFSRQAYQMLGPTLLQPTPPALPAVGGETSQQNLVTVPSTGQVASGTSLIVNFANATGLDTGNLVGGRPIVRSMVSFRGFGGQVLNGMGYATLTTGAAYTSMWDLSATAAVGLLAFEPLQWVATQATDSSGRISRHRALLLDSLINQLPAPPAIPTVTAPAGPFTGSPSITFADVVPGAAAVGFLVGASVVQVVDAAGRSWRLYVTDSDAPTGSETVQFPDLLTHNVAGLAPGAWTATAEARVFYTESSATTASFVLAEMRRLEVAYSRSIGRQITVQ